MALAAKKMSSHVQRNGEAQLLESEHGLTTREAPPPPRRQLKQAEAPRHSGAVPWLPDSLPRDATPAARAPPPSAGPSPPHSFWSREMPSPPRGLRYLEPSQAPASGAAGCPSVHCYPVHSLRAARQVHAIPANLVYVQDKGAALLPPVFVFSAF